MYKSAEVCKVWWETFRNHKYGRGESRKYKTYEGALKYAAKVGGSVQIFQCRTEIITTNTKVFG